MYLTYEEYTEYGGTLDETTFNDLAFEAGAQIDWYTFNRFQAMDASALDERVKRCMYRLIQIVQANRAVNQTSGNGNDADASAIQAGVMSQSNDGVSISYNILAATEIIKTSPETIKNCIQQYLSGVTDALGRKVLYRGIYPDE